MSATRGMTGGPPAISKGQVFVVDELAEGLH